MNAQSSVARNEPKSWYLDLRNLYAVRLALFFGLVELARIGSVVFITYAMGTTVGGLFSAPFVQLLPLLVAATLLALSTYWLCVRYVEGRTVFELRPSSAIIRVPLGLGGGGLMFAAIFAAIWAHGDVAYRGYVGVSHLPAAASIFAVGVLYEELIYRGAAFRIVEESCGTAAALICSALLFGASHFANSGASITSALAIAIAGGVTFGLAYSLTRSLWLPIGLHLGWNFTQGALFGATVSGYTVQGAFSFDLSGSDLVTGGAFGPEASIYTIAFGVPVASILAWLTWRSGRWVPARLRMRQFRGVS